MTNATPQLNSFSVFKDVTGRYRWLAISSTAYQDRDGEIVSTKALADDVARADRDGKYGPLRWWHVGQPNPLNADAPWGPGVDLGWCDFNAMSGKCLIESGTFITEEIGAAVATTAKEHALSIGFSHPFGQPDVERVFHDIRRFERSLAPRDRVSNPFTMLSVSKESRPMDELKIAALKGLGFTDDMIKGVVAQAQTVEKTAQDQGVRFKASTFVEDVATFTRLKASGLTDEQALKALEAFKAPPAAEPPAQQPATPPAAQPQAQQPAASPGIEALVQSLSAQLVPALTNAVTSAMGGATTKKDAELAELQKQQQALIAQQQQIDTQLKTLLGDQPASTGYRASESAEAAAVAAMFKAGGVLPTQQPTDGMDAFIDGWIQSGQRPQAS